MKKAIEFPLIFRCKKNQLIAIINQADEKESLGVLILVGGSQYRVGSHRQFVLLARALADEGVSVMRFDHVGMGDSEGEVAGFESLDKEIGGAIDVFMEHCPYLTGIVIWGICDAASAALFYGYQDERVKGLILLNPWVTTEKSAAKIHLKQYYLQRLRSLGFWSKVFKLKTDYLQSLSSILSFIRQAVPTLKSDQKQRDLPGRMGECFEFFMHPVLLILSGKDLTSAQFKVLIKQDEQWKKLLLEDRVARFDISDADHTFSSEIYRKQVFECTLGWLQKTGKSNQ